MDLPMSWLTEGARDAIGWHRPALPREAPRLHETPWLGSVVELSRSGLEFFRRAHREQGPVFQFHLMNLPVVGLVGPQLNRFFFEETGRALSIREPYQFMIKLLSDRWFFLAPTDQYEAQRARLLPLFTPRRMAVHLQAMVREAELLAASWGEGGELEVNHAFGDFTLLTAVRAFCGEEVRDRWATKLPPVFRDFCLRADPALPPWLPLPKFARSDRAQAQLHRWVGELIAERRAAPNGHDDLLQTLMDDPSFDDPLRVNLLLGMFFAGHETTAGFLSWAVVDVLGRSQVLAGVREEGERLAPLGYSLEALRQMHFLTWALKESERFHTVLPVLMRTATRDLEVEGFAVPAGRSVMVSPALTHRLSEVWTEPDHFDPLRFSPERREDRTPYSLIGFGGGRHRCTGMSFAYLEVMVLLSELVRRFDFELVNGVPPIAPGPGATRPLSPCRLRYQRRGSFTLRRGGDYQ
jgi:sterol 14-demethylase